MHIASITRLFCLSAFVLFAVVLLAQAPEIDWQRALGGSLDEVGRAMAITDDGGYIALGSARSNNGNVPGNFGLTDWWGVKLNAQGIIDWSMHYGGSNFDQPNSIRQTSDGGYIAVGSTRSNNMDVSQNQGLYDLWVVKLTSTGTIEWERTYGGSADDAAFDIEETMDGGYVVVGETRSSDGDVSFNNGFTDCWLIKISSIGNLLWERSYGGSAGETGFSVRATSDGGFVIGAIASSSNGDITNPLGLEDFWVIKTDAQGAIQWQRNYGGSNSESGCTVLPLPDGGYILGGTTFSDDGNIDNYAGLGDFWIAELDGSGGIVWSRTLGGSSTDRLQSLALLPSGDIIVSGFTDSNDGDVSANNGGRDAWLIRLSSTGALVWQRAMGGSGSDSFNKVLHTPDSGYILVGSSTSNNGDLDTNNGGSDLWVVKLQSDPTSVDELSTYELVSCWPNPTTDRVWMDAGEYGKTWTHVHILTASGTMVREQLMNSGNTSTGPIEIDLSGLSSGLYQVVFSDGDRQGLVKVVKE
jgi:hypothetical protein